MSFRHGLLSGLIFCAVGAGAAPDYVISDFETGQLNTPLNGFWYFFTDRNSATPVDTVFGNSTLSSVDEYGFPFYDSLGLPDARTFPPGRDSASRHSLKFAYSLGDRRLSCGTACTYAPYVGFGLGFSTLSDTVDLSTAAGIAFWARAEKAPLVLNVSVATRDTTTNAPDYSQRLVIDTAWKRYTIELKASDVFKQPSYGARKPFVSSLVKAMNFGVNRGENDSLLAENALYLDDLVILDWEYVDPTGVRRVAARRASAGADLAGSGGRMRYLLPVGRGKGLIVDVSGRISPQP